MSAAGKNESEQLSTRRDSKESSKNSVADDGIDPPGFFIEETGIHKNKKHADDESTLSGFQPKQKKNKKSKTETIGEDSSPETETLFKSVHQVEERLKAREQYKLVIHKFGISKLISAHRLLKNQPWLRAAYGQTVTWTMPSPQRLQEDKKSHTTNAFDHVRCSCNSDGSAADWSGLDWSFNIERNTIDRQDFVLAVCSRDVVVGRYVLSKDDLSELLTQQLDLQKSNKNDDDDSGQLFMVEGDILNDLGKAGHVTLLCRVVPVVEKMTSSPIIVKPVSVIEANHSSKGVEKDVTVENSMSATREEQNGSAHNIVDGIASVSMENKPTMETIKTNNQVTNNKLSDIPVIEDDFDIDQQMIGVQDALAAEAVTRPFVCLRILGAAVMDLKAMHLFEPNSPVLFIESDTWQTQTEAKRQSGPAAKWTGLFWKVNVRRDVGLLVTVTSLDKQIGRALLTTEELLSSPAIQFSQQEPANSGSISVTNANLQIHQLVKTLSNGSDYTGRVKINMIVNHPDDLVDALQIFANDHLTQTFAGSILQNKAIFHPFQIMVREAVALEIAVPAWLRLLRPGRMNIPITLHCAAGSWAQSTNVVHSDGKLAHWLALGWCVPLLSEASAMRLTLWCGDVSVGAASLSPDELKTLLLHHTNSSLYSGNNSGEVLVQLRDVRGHVAAKLKLHCRYDVLPVANDGTVIINNRPASGMQRPMSASVNNNKVINNLNAVLNRRPISAVNTIKESTPTATSDPMPLSAGLFLPGGHNAFQNLPQQQSSAESNPFLVPSQFPIMVTFVELSLVDLLVPSSMLGSLPMFLAHPSGPVLQLLCDRQSLNTASLPEDDHDHHQINYGSGGQQQQSTRWMHLPPKQWTLRIRHDSSFTFAASMRRGKHVQPIGKAQLQPLDQLLGLPVDCNNYAQLTVTIRSPEGDVAGRVVMKMFIRSVVSENSKDANINVQDSLFGVSVAQDDNPYNAANIENSKARMRIEEMQRQARENIGHLRQEAQLIPTMPWNQHCANSELDNNNNVVFGGLSVASNNNNKDGNKTLFDPQVIMDAAHSLHPQHNIQFRVCIDEIDLWELRKVHRLKRNDCRVAAASGKWTASTIAASQMRSKQTKHYYLQSGLDQNSLDEIGSDMAADRCFWTKLGWKFSVFEKQQRLRLTVSSRGRVLGGTVVLVEDLMELAADDKGGRRLTAELLGPDDEFAGNIQLTFHLDVLQSANSNTSIPTARNFMVPFSASNNKSNNNNNMTPMLSPSANNSYVDTDDDVNAGWGYTPHHVMEERRFSASSRGAQYVFGAEPSVLSRGYSILSSNQFNRNHTMDPVDADEHDRNMRQLPRFPCILLLRDLAALDLLPLQQPKSLLQLSKQKKQKHLGHICIEVYAENFFQTTELNWSVAVQEASVVRLVVRDDFKNEIGHCDLSPKQLWIVPPNSNGVREVMLPLERDGLCAGKLIARALFQPLPPLLINNPPNTSSSVLYNMQVNHKYNQQAGAGVIIDEHRYNDSVTNSQILPPANIDANSNNNNSNSHQRGRSHSMQSQQSLLQPGNLLEHSVTSETHQTKNGASPYVKNNNMDNNKIVSQRQFSPDITYVVDTPHNNNNINANNARPRLASHGEESVLTYDTVSPLQSRRSSIQPPSNSNFNNNLAINTYANQYNNCNNNYNNVNSPSQQQPTQTLRPSFNNSATSNVVTTKDVLAQRAPPPLLTTSDSQNNSSSFFPSLFQRSSKNNSNKNSNNNTNNNSFNNFSSLPSLSVGDTLSSVRVVIRAIALIDLPRAHTFAANQPVISLACGRFTATLPVNSNTNTINNNTNNSNSSGTGGAMSMTDGQTAAWDHLQISFSFDQGAQLRVHVTSRGSTIGICALNRQRVLSGRRSAQSGAFVIVDELLPPTANNAGYKAAGKLKLVYDLPDLASPSHT